MSFKNKIASGLGCVLEWYEFSLYGFFAPVLAKLYFPGSTSEIGLIKTFSVFAVGFFARPLGALIFGHISDKYGRVVSLKITPLLITCPTFLLCLLPTFQQIGNFAPVLLTFLRICQGICMGGEYTNNLVYLCESVERKNIYFIGSIGSCTGSMGILFASIISSLCYSFLTPDQLFLWGWRVAFGFSLVLGIITFAIRRNIQETAVFQQIQKTKRIENPIFYSVKKQWQDYLIALGIALLPATSFYYVFIFLPNYFSKILNNNSASILGDNSLSLSVRLLIIPIIGLIADKIEGLKIAMLSASLFACLSAPLFYVALHKSDLIFICVLIFALLTTLNASTTPGLLVKLLAPKTRCTIFSFTFNICFGIFGGVTPVIGFLLLNKFGNKMAPIVIIISASIITLIAIFFARNRIHKYEY